MNCSRLTGGKYSRVADRSDYGGIRGLAWSPDGRWLAYGFTFLESEKTAIKLCNLETGEPISDRANSRRLSRLL